MKNMRNVNKKEIMRGVNVIYEDDFIKKLWALNDKYPEYVHCVHFDNVSEPYHKIDECKSHFKSTLISTCDNYMKKLTEAIHIAEEEGDEKGLTFLLAIRKEVRKSKEIDVSHCKTIDEMYDLIPKDLRDYWPTKESI